MSTGTVPRPRKLIAADRRVLARDRYARSDRARIAHLYAPYEATFLRYVARGPMVGDPSNHLWRSFRLCARMMLELGCTYWAFTWERLLAWRAEQERLRADRSPGWRQNWHVRWTEVTATLFFLEVLPYSEEIYRANHMELAYKWLGREVAQAIQERFVEMALTIGYRHRRQALKRGAAVVLMVLTAKRTTDLASITRSDLEAWEARTRRSRRVARQGVTSAEKVLAAMGYLQGEAPRRLGGASRSRASWGRTAPAIIDTCERFLADLRTVRRPNTVNVYEGILRRFGDWLGHADPTVRSVADVRRPHIEAYKQAVAAMKIGDYTSALRPGHLGQRRGQPLSRSHQFRHTLAVQWRKNGMKIETISRMLGHTSLRMTMRYAAVMPETLRREFDQAFAAIDDEHRITAQVRVVLSPEAHLAASAAWRESLWVDLGIGWCGLSAFLPCDNRLACLPCPNYIEKREHLPLFQEQHSHLLELRILGTGMLPADRNDEIASAVEALDGRIVAMGGTPGQVPAATPRDEPAMDGDQRATPEHHGRRDNRLGARRGPGAPAPGAPREARAPPRPRTGPGVCSSDCPHAPAAGDACGVCWPALPANSRLLPQRAD